MTETLFRSTFDVGDLVGRTLSGLAYPYDKPNVVRDVVRGAVGPRYREAFAPGSGDVSMRQHPDGFPVFSRHDYARDPFGIVTFKRSSEGTIFEAVLLNTTEGNDNLELVNSGLKRSVSVGFRPVKHITRAFPDGAARYRTEVALRELSLVPTGQGQYADAEVQAVREAVDELGTPVLDALQRRRARLHNLT